MAHRGATERRFLDDVTEREGRIDAPTVDGAPPRIGIAIRRVRTSAPLAIVGEPHLRRREIETFCQLNESVVLGRKADLGLMTKHFLGERRFADLGKLGRALDIEKL